MSSWAVVILRDVEYFKKYDKNCYGIHFGLGNVKMPSIIEDAWTNNEKEINRIILKIKKIQTHLTDCDLCGFIREKWGVKILNPNKNNEPYNHITEVNCAKKGLENQLEELKKLQKSSERNYGLRHRCISLIDAIKWMLAELDEVFAFAQKYKR